MVVLSSDIGQCGPAEEGTEIQIDFDITESMVSTEQAAPSKCK